MKKKNLLTWYKNWHKSVRNLLMSVKAFRGCKHNTSRAYVTKVLVSDFGAIINERGSICTACGRIITVYRMPSIVSLNKGERYS